MPEASCCCCWHQKAAEPRETRGSFIVSLLPGARDRRSSCLVLPSPSLEPPACHQENRTSVLTSWARRLREASRCFSQSSRRTFSRKPAPAWCFPRLIFYYTWIFPVSHLTALQSARATNWAKLCGQTGCTWAQGEEPLKGAAVCWCFF